MNAEVEYAIGRFMKVRKLAGTYQIVDSWTVGRGKYQRRRYRLIPVPNTGALLLSTEAFADTMEPLPVGATYDELTLVPDPPAPPFPSDAIPAGLHIPDATAPQEHAAPAGHTEPAPDAARSVADAVRSGPAEGFTLDAGAFGGELDEYSVGARYERAATLEEPGELRNPFKPVRKFPRRPTYKELRGIVYNSYFKGFEDWSEHSLCQLPQGSPIAVVVTHETNGHAIWILTMEDKAGERCANLEIFYPNAPGSSADAIEYAVLLALRQVPVRSEDLEIVLLELAS